MLRFLAIAATVAALGLSTQAGAETYELRIEGFACELCARSLQSRLSRLDDVVDVSASFEESEAIVHTREGARLTEEEAREVVEGAGFELSGYRELPGRKPESGE